MRTTSVSFAALVSVAFAVLAPAQAGAASSGLSKHQRECLQSLVSGAENVPVAVAEPLEAALLASFAVLRRPATPADQIPPLSPIGQNVDSQIRTWYPAYTRQVGKIGKHRYYLIPAFLKEEHVPSANCLPPGERAERPKYVEAARKRANEPAFCLAPAESEGLFGSSSTCETFAEAQTGVRPFLAGGIAAERTLELVPDGVVAVRVTYAGSPALLAPVAENVYSFEAPRAVLTKLGRELHRLDKALRSARHLSARQRKKQGQRFLRQIARVFTESEPRAIEWLGPGNAGVRVTGRPGPRQIAGLLGL